MVNTLKIYWSRLSHLPYGKWVFSKMIGFFIPYTGTISPYVIEVRPGFAQVYIKDKKKHRNHLCSIHALALANLGELTCGLAFHFMMEPNQRAILTNLTTDYLKKARGRIVATATASFPENVRAGSFKVEANLVDQQNITVAKVSTVWLLNHS
jgi:acyl-coenzyme A thioesterase PaaI-like protein